MRAISLWQPWASAMALGYKKFETRHWAHRYRGHIAIHAAKRWSREEREFAALMAREMADNRLATPPLGAIVAIGELVKISRSEEVAPRIAGTMEEMWGNYAPGRFVWRFERIVALPEPIPFAGSQGFFEVPNRLLP